MSDTHATPEEAVANSRWAEASGAQAKAAQTPSTVRKAMLSRPRTVCGITLHPLSLDVLWTLEAIGHPLGTPGSAETELSPLRIAQMVYAFAEPGTALDLASQGEDFDGGKLSRFDKAAFAFVRTNNLFPNLPELGAAVATMITEGLAAAPGDGNPTETAAQ